RCRGTIHCELFARRLPVPYSSFRRPVIGKPKPRLSHGVNQNGLTGRVPFQRDSSFFITLQHGANNTSNHLTGPSNVLAIPPGALCQYSVHRCPRTTGYRPIP